MGGDDEFEGKPVERDSEEGIGSFTGISTSPKSLVEENPEVGRMFLSVRVQSRCSGDDAGSVFPFLRPNHVLCPFSLVPESFSFVYVVV